MTITNVEEAWASGLYDTKIQGEDELEWTDPKERETYGPVEEGFAERPTFVRCLNCSRVHRYRTPVRFQDWAIKHGVMCRERKEDE